jgi:hypothetical protein
MESQLRYEEIKKTKQEPRWDSKLLEEKDDEERYVTAIYRKLGNEGDRSIEERWGELNRTIIEFAEKQLVRKSTDT